jgi:hypothetical protein
MVLADSPISLLQPIHEKHQDFFGRIKQRGLICGLKDGNVPPPPKGWEQGAMGSVTKYMTKDIQQFFVDYGFRSEIGLSRRDVFKLKIRLTQVDHRIVVDDVVMFYVKSFSATHAECFDDRLGSWSWSSCQEIGRISKRYIFIHQLTWISSQHAWEELQVSPREIGERVAPVAERVECFPDGVYIVLDSRPLTMAEAKEKTLAANLALYPEIEPIIPNLLAIDE